MGFDMNTAKGSDGVLYKAILPTTGSGDVIAQAGDSSGRLLPGDVNTIITIAASALVTPQTINFDYVNPYYGSAVLVEDITAVAGTTHTLDVKLQVKDAVSGQFVDLVGAAFAQKSAAGTTILQIIPNIIASANIALSNRIPAVFRVVQVIAGTGVTPSVTYSLSMLLMR